MSLAKTAHSDTAVLRHLPPNTAIIDYATEGALFISSQLSTDAVSALRKVWVLIRLWKQHGVVNTKHVNTKRVCPGVKKEKKRSSGAV